jgi:ATP-dependent DNA helicase RecG
LSGTLLPVYPGSEKLSKRGINNKFFQNIIFNLLKDLPQLISENLPDYLLKSMKLMGRLNSYYNIHFPKDFKHFEAADRRLKFEEAFSFS